MISTRGYLTAKLAYEIDVQDVAAGLAAGRFVLVDTRRTASWEHGHVPGARHVPTDLLPHGATERLGAGTEVVVYGWGPGCNGGTKTAAVLAELGYSVREMIGGFEYWCRSGLPVETATGITRYEPDPLVIAHRATA